MTSNLAALLKPFLPFSSEKIQLWLGASAQWKPQFIASGATIAQPPEILFEKLDRKVAEEEIGKLNNR